MKKIATIITIFILFSGCQLMPGTSKSLVTDADYKKGFDALSLKFIEKPALKEAYEDTQFSLNLLLENKGAHDIGDGIVKIAVEEDYLSLETSSFYDFSLNGKSITSTKGEQDLTTYSLNTKSIPDPESTTHTTHTYVTSCYNYQTDFSQDVCIDTDIYGLKQDKPCTQKDITLGGGQGAPVAVTKIETTMFYHSQENQIEPRFTIYIENKGNGNVINKYKIEEICSSTATEEGDYNLIDITAELFERTTPIKLNCKPENPIKLKEKQRKVVCTYTEGINTDSGTYTTPLHINIDYGYTTTISKDITIKKLMP